MNFTFVRAERSQEENQERAFIAASRRQDRDFTQRLESLQKASELHFARTGKRFLVAQSQVTHNGPLIEFVGAEKKRKEARRFMPYTLDRSNVGTVVTDRGFLHKDTNSAQHRMDQITQTVIPGAPQEHLWNQNALQDLDQRDCALNTPPFEAPALPLVDIYETQNNRDMDTKGTLNFERDGLDNTFWDFEYWQGYQDDLDNLDMQSFLGVDFSGPRLTRSDEAERVGLENVEREGTT
jgi:hypothetical protein